MTRYIWCEDSGSGFVFWKAVFATIDKDIKVQSKGNNTKLRQAAEKIYDDGNQYFLIMDNAVDNADVLRETRRLYQTIKNKNNVKTIKIHSFEYVLLSFEFLEDWVFASDNRLKEKRLIFLEARKIFLDIEEHGASLNELEKLKYYLDYSSYMNSEQLCAKLLFEITRNTGFEITKGDLGECFVNSCFECIRKQNKNVCGLNKARKGSYDKIKKLIEYSVLKNALQRVGILC